MFEESNEILKKSYLWFLNCSTSVPFSMNAESSRQSKETIGFLLYIYLWFLDVLNGLYFIRYTGVLFNQFYILL